MTNEEAIKTIEALKNLEKAYRNSDSDSIFSVTLKPYVTLEDLRNAISALDKQIPKKPLNVANSIEDLRFDWTCPSCKRQFIGASYCVNHCVDCGQKLDWTEGEEE